MDEEKREGVKKVIMVKNEKKEYEVKKDMEEIMKEDNMVEKKKMIRIERDG